jgi:hypothetical protein
MQQRNNALLNTAVAGEARKAGEFNTLGQAAQMKAREDMTAFNQNQVAPFERNYNLYAAKASGAAARQNSNMQNLSNSLVAAASLYGGESSGSSGSGKGGVNGFSNIFGRKRRGDYTQDDSLPQYG